MTPEQAHQRLKELDNAAQLDPAYVDLTIDAVCRAIAAIHGCPVGQTHLHIASLLERLSLVQPRMDYKQHQWWQLNRPILYRVANLNVPHATTCKLNHSALSLDRLRALETRWARAGARRRLL